MSRICEICGKRPQAGKNIVRRGMAKKKGGAGRKITGTSHRRFLPNLKQIRARINGKVKYIKVCVECIKSAKVKKAI